jgi:hypothetical protein
MTIGAVLEGNQVFITPKTVIKDKNVTNKKTFITIIQPLLLT